MESEKGRQFQRKTYREEASRRPTFLTLKLYTAGTGWVNSGREDPGFLAGSGGGENVLTAFLPTPLNGHCPWWKQSREKSLLDTLGLSALNEKK